MPATKRSKEKSRSKTGPEDRLSHEAAENRLALPPANQVEQAQTVAPTDSESAPLTDNSGGDEQLVREEIVPAPPAPGASKNRSSGNESAAPDMPEPREVDLTDDTAGAGMADEKASVPKEIQLVCFRLGREEYGVDISCVQEINRVPQIVGIPDVPLHVKGVINLRGRVTPIIDLRLLLGLPPIEYGGKTRIIVLNRGNRLTGLVVDDVTQVLHAARSAVIKPPGLTTSLGREFLTGIYQGGDSMILIIDCERMLGKDDQGRESAR